MRRLIKIALGRRARAAIGLVFASTALCSGQNAESARTTSPLISAEGYERLLDSIFPREQIASLKVGYTMILRFEPNQGPESQLLFRVWYDGHIDAQMWTVKSGSAWRLANEYITRTGNEDIATVARLVAVEKTQIELNATQVQKWHTSLFDILRSSDSQLQKAAAEYFKQGVTDAVLDGTRYEFWYTQGMIEARWTFFDIDVNDLATRANLPLARWMNEVRAASKKTQ